MKKIFSVIFVLSFIMLFSSLAIAETINEMARFKIDTDLTQAGYQTSDSILGVPAEGLIGFGIYVKDAEALRSFNIDVVWDSEQASLDRMSDVYIEEDTMEINGGEIDVAEEENVLGEPTLGPGEIKEDGHYYAAYAKMGGDDVVVEDWGLLYFFVLEVAKDDAKFDVRVRATVGSSEGGGSVRYIGQWHLYVNTEGPVGVKESTWGRD